MDNKEFAPASGKTIETVAFSSQPDFHIFTLRFQDKTALVFRVEPRFTVRADYSDWKTGDQRVLKEWPAISSASYFDSAILGMSILEWHGIADAPPMHVERYDDESWLQSQLLLLVDAAGRMAIGYCQQSSEEEEAEFEPAAVGSFGQTVKWAILPATV